MPPLILKSTRVRIDTTLYSDEVSSVQLALEVSTEDGMTFADDLWAVPTPAIKSARITINFKKKADLSGLDAAIWTQIIGDGVVDVEVEKDDGARSVSNPTYKANFVIADWSPIAGGVGQLHQNSVTWPSQGAVQRLTV